jgi:FPC/CPF motif-containing protein YcgG
MVSPTTKITYLFQATAFSLPKAGLTDRHKSGRDAVVMEVPGQTNWQFDGAADKTNFEDSSERQESHLVIEYFMDGAGI